MLLVPPRVLLLCLGAVLVLTPVAVQAVPAQPADVAVIVVRVGGDRVSGATTDTASPDAAIDPVAGARLGLFAAPGDPEPVPHAWATCVSDASGDCTFRVPDTAPGGANRDARFTVAQLSAPAGWSANPALRTSTLRDGAARTAYRFRTGPELRAGTTYSSGSDFMFTPATAEHLDDAVASSGVWQQSRTNPSLAQRCGLDVALVLDTSSSVGPAMPQLVAAADALTDALTGTRSRMAAFSFAALSPGASAAPNHPDLTSVATPAGARAFKEQFADWAPAPGTSWDRGLFMPTEAAEHYDVAVVITDGYPTTYGDPRPAGSAGYATRFKELEYGIASANALKAGGTRVIALGVGSDLDLAPISGPTRYDGSNAVRADRFALSDYRAAGAALRDLATSLCRGSLSVVTQVRAPGRPSTPVGPGWTFRATTATSGVSGLPRSVTTADDGTGAVSFRLGFGAGTSHAGVRVTPEAPAGYRVVTQRGRNAVCRDLGSHARLPVRNLAGGGFRVGTGPRLAVSCSVLVTRTRPPLATTATITRIQDDDRDGVVDPRDAISYEFGITNVSRSRLRNLLVVSPAIGAVVCPVVALEPAESTTCVGHAPYVVGPADVVDGSVRVGARAEARDASGATRSSRVTVLTTKIGDRIPVALNGRRRR